MTWQKGTKMAKEQDNRPFYKRGVAGCVYRIIQIIVILALAALGAAIIIG